MVNQSLIVSNTETVNLIISSSHPQSLTLIGIVIGLGALIAGGYLLYAVKRKNETEEIIKNFKGNKFIKGLKKELFKTYSFLAKSILWTLSLSFVGYAYTLFLMCKIFFYNGEYPLTDIVKPILITLALAMVSNIISIYLHAQKEKLKEIANFEKTEDIPSIPESLREDIKKLENRFGLLQLKEKELERKIIEAIAQQIKQEE